MMLGGSSHATTLSIKLDAMPKPTTSGFATDFIQTTGFSLYQRPIIRITFVMKEEQV